ncbi:MAG: hypothetical protein R2688_09150 [Fimbriimonadaceae bacterium]
MNSPDFHPQRGGQLTDVLIDLIGVSLAVGFFAWRSHTRSLAMQRELAIRQ